MQRRCGLSEESNVGFLPTGQREQRRKGAVKDVAGVRGQEI